MKTSVFKPPVRVGTGYDVHQLVPGRALILGGVPIAYDKGLLGHSDADVLVHAIMDALLGALALGDIGAHFPDTDAAYKNIDSMVLLARTAELIAQSGYCIGNIDAVIIAQAPKLAPYIAKMRTRIAEVLELPENLVSVKATTEEGLGFTGAGQGMAAQAAVCLIARPEVRL